MMTSVRRRTVLQVGCAAGATAVGIGSAEAAPGGEVLIGQSAILSGPIGSLVNAAMAGANLAFRQFNAQGGAGGRKVRLISLDDALVPDRAIKNYRELIDQQVVCFFGGVGSPTTMAAEPVLRESGLPLVGSFGVADSVRYATRGFAYYVAASYQREMEAIIGHLATINIRRIGLAYADTNGGREALELFRTALLANHCKETDVASIRPDGADAELAGKKLGTTKPEAVVLFIPGPSGASVMKGFWTTGAAAQFYGLSITDPNMMHGQLGPKSKGIVLSEVMPYPGNDSDPFVARFRRLAVEAHITSDYRAMEGYVNATVLVEALRQVAGPITPASLHQSLRRTRLKCGPMQIDYAAGQTLGSSFVELVMLGNEGSLVH